LALQQHIENHPLSSSPQLPLCGDFVASVVEEFLQKGTLAISYLLLCPTEADTQLAGLGLEKHLLVTHSNDPDTLVVTIECSDYAETRCAELLSSQFLEKLKLSSSHLDDAKKDFKLLVILNNYHHLKTYDNIYIKNKLASFAKGAQVFAVCWAQFFKFRGYLSTFLLNVSE
jgi:hypothetical protein